VLHKLNRKTFTTSRLAEFASEAELVRQTGHAVEDWPLVILKELVDNALDACEEAKVAPEIDIVVDGAGITVSDNGLGISTETVKLIFDFGDKTSRREAYVSPTRGAQDKCPSDPPCHALRPYAGAWRDRYRKRRSPASDRIHDRPSPANSEH
jgi:hypothetical protein